MMTINDMTILLAAVELAVKRGAFSILEIQQVGAVSEKLTAFLNDAREQAEKAEKEAQGEQAASAEQAQPVADAKA
jgi:hypothetical protein